MPGELLIQRKSTGSGLLVNKSVEVPEHFWLAVRSEWGQAGRNPAQEIQVPVDLFLSHQAWLPPLLRRFGVAVHLDDGAKELLARYRSDATALQDAMTSPSRPQDTHVPIQFTRELRGFQTRDLEKIAALAHGANFSVPGAGKTTVELAVYSVERDRGRVSRMLVVAPLSAFETWEEDSAICLSPQPVIARYKGEPVGHDVEILLVNYHRLANGFEDLVRWCGQSPTLVVLDEAHRMKRGHDGEWGAACLNLAFHAERRDILTGTPAPQHPSDLIALVNYLWPGQAGSVLPADALVPQPSPTAVASVSSAIGPLFVRTTKAELGLRPPEHSIIPIPLEGLHRDIYRALLADFGSLASTQHDRVNLQRLGEITMYLLEAATNPALLPAGSSDRDPIEFRHPPLPIPKGSRLYDLLAEYRNYETPRKFIQLASHVEELVTQGRKVLIWSNFVRNIETLERMFARYDPAVAYGGIPLGRRGDRNRESELRRFRNESDCQVLLANPAAIAEGVSLHTVCHDAIYLERTFNAGQYLQSVDRIHRLGLSPDQETRVWFYVSEGTIDELVANRVEAKARNLAAMLNDPSIVEMALPDDDDIGMPISLDEVGDIEALFRHLRGEPS